MLCKRLWLHSTADFDDDANAEMRMPRLLNGHFPGFCQFRMEKNELVVEMKTWYDFP